MRALVVNDMLRVTGGCEHQLCSNHHRNLAPAKLRGCSQETAKPHLHEKEAAVVVCIMLEVVEVGRYARVAQASQRCRDRRFAGTAHTAVLEVRLAARPLTFSTSLARNVVRGHASRSRLRTLYMPPVLPRPSRSRIMYLPPSTSPG